MGHLRVFLETRTHRTNSEITSADLPQVISAARDSSVDFCWSTVVAANTNQSPRERPGLTSRSRAHQKTQRRLGHEADDEAPCGVLPAAVPSTSSPGIRVSHDHLPQAVMGLLGKWGRYRGWAFLLRHQKNRGRRVGGSELSSNGPLVVHAREISNTFVNSQHSRHHDNPGPHPPAVGLEPNHLREASATCRTSF